MKFALMFVLLQITYVSNINWFENFKQFELLITMNKRTKVTINMNHGKCLNEIPMNFIFQNDYLDDSKH